MEYMPGLNKLNVNKPLVGSKFILLVVLGIGFILGLSVGYMIGAITSSTNEVHITEEPLNLHPTDRPTVIPTVVNLSVKYADWQEYVLGDCRTKLYAPHNWVSERKGSYGACGILYSPATVDNYNFNNIDGFKILFAELGSDFEYGFGNDFDIDEYILETQAANIYDEVDDDIFIASEQYNVELYESRHVKVNRGEGIGITNNLFYKISDKWYVIMWNDVDTKYEDDILLMLESIRST